MNRPILPLAAALVILVTPPHGPAAADMAPVPPRLVVVLTIDQMRGDYLQRWAGQWRGGFRRLLSEGAVFPNGLQDHALTETAPGHATILSGREPRHTGIVINQLGVQDTSTTILGAPGAMGASPRRFVGTTLVDWMARADTGFRFLSVSPKDRGAILPIGRARGPVFWYLDGRFTTSTFYADSLPTWLTAWNARDGAGHLAGTSWSPLLADSMYQEPDSEPYENGGRDIVFPHPLGDAAKVRAGVKISPWIDSLTLDVALEGSRALGLGQRGRPDLLAVSLSGTDYIGHTWGPDSRELHDQLLRLDRWLGVFLDSLGSSIPRDRILIVLTGDHGVTSYPEFARAHGHPGGRIGLSALVGEVNAAIVRHGGEQGIVKENSGLIFADTTKLRAAGVSPESLATSLAPRVWRMPGVVTAWTPATLAGSVPSDVHAARWWRSLSDNFPWLVCAVAKPGYIWADDTATAAHGTTNPDDVGVPIALLGPLIRPGVYADTVRTVDIGPTLARHRRRQDGWEAGWTGDQAGDALAPSPEFPFPAASRMENPSAGSTRRCSADPPPGKRMRTPERACVRLTRIAPVALRAGAEPAEGFSICAAGCSWYIRIQFEPRNSDPDLSPDVIAFSDIALLPLSPLLQLLQLGCHAE